MGKTYRMSKSVKKGLGTAAAIAIAIITTLSTVSGMPDGKEITVAICLSALVGGIRAGMNYYKQNSGSNGEPKIKR